MMAQQASQRRMARTTNTFLRHCVDYSGRVPRTGLVLASPIPSRNVPRRPVLSSPM
jgi:hypothetical protein